MAAVVPAVVLAVAVAKATRVTQAILTNRHQPLPGRKRSLGAPSVECCGSMECHGGVEFRGPWHEVPW